MVRAEMDFTEIIDRIAADNQLAPQKMATRFERSFEFLERNPMLGRIVRDEHIASKGFRTLLVHDYNIFYKIERKTIHIHRILHGARDYAKLF